jgi:hypothetical protein
MKEFPNNPVLDLTNKFYQVVYEQEDEKVRKDKVLVAYKTNWTH